MANGKGIQYIYNLQLRRDLRSINIRIECHNDFFHCRFECYHYLPSEENWTAGSNIPPITSDPNVPYRLIFLVNIIL